MKAFILAGGFATRLWPLTEKRAKPLLPLAGVPLIEYLVRDIPEDVPVTISTNATFKEPFEQWAEALGRPNIEILIEDVKSDDQKLGALGATAQWITDAPIDDDVMLLAGDNYCGKDFLTDFFTVANSQKYPLLAIHDIGDKELAKSFGTVILGDEIIDALGVKVVKITDFEEKPTTPKSTYISTGASYIPKSLLKTLVEYAKEHPDNIGGIFEEFLNQKKEVRGFIAPGKWFDIGSFDAYIEATKALVGDQPHIANTSTIDNESKCNGSVVVGAGSIVKRSDLTDVVIFEDCTIEDCELSNCVLDKGCRLQGVDLTGKMLRERTTLKRT